MRSIQITEFSENPSDADLEKIRHDAGNPNLSPEDVVLFGKSLIARTDVAGNGIRFSRQSLIDAAPTFIGRPINFDHDSRKATRQIGRIFDAYTSDVAEATFLFVHSYAIRTDEDADLHKKLMNRQHREQSMGIRLLAAQCCECGTELETPHFSCLKHPTGEILVTQFSGEHLSYVGEPAIEGAGILADQERLVRIFSDLGDDPEQTIRELRRDADDGKAFREFVTNEFVKWYGLVIPDSEPEEIATLAEKLTATEMCKLARIQKDRFHEVLPQGGRQMMSSSPEPDEQAETIDEPISLRDIATAMKG